MSQRARAVVGERLDPARAFAIVGNETRLAILQALLEEPSGCLPFADLRKRVAMADGSQFNYHLKKLTGPFVRRTDDGYQIRHAGVHVIRTIVQGSFTDHPRIEPFETGGACVDCGAPLLAEYRHEMVFITCASCEMRHTMGMFPPAAVVDRTNTELLEAFDRWQRHDFALSVGGVSAMCGGISTPSLVRDSADVPIHGLDITADEFRTFDLGMVYRCAQCDAWDYGTPGMHLLNHPLVVAFHDDHGVDLAATPYWELEWVVTNQRTTVVSEDPFRVEVVIPLDDEELRAVLDDAFEVVATERLSTAP